MRTAAVLPLIGLLLMAPAGATAQEPTKFELGIHAGATILLPDGGDAEVVAGVPGAGSLLGLFPPIYATLFATPNLMIEPQIAFVYETITKSGLLNATLQAGYLLSPQAHGSPYLAAHLHTVNAFGDGGDTEFAAGASVGYRHVLKGILGLRYEARYRRWFDGDFNEVALIVGFGAALH